jgi:hypothetical protein
MKAWVARVWHSLLPVAAVVCSTALVLSAQQYHGHRVAQPVNYLTNNPDLALICADDSPVHGAEAEICTAPRQEAGQEGTFLTCINNLMLRPFDVHLHENGEH